MKALITGVNGFVGEYLAAYLQTKQIEVHGTIIIGECRNPDVQVRYMDILDEKQTLEVISEIQPDCIYHLAGQANVGLSWKEPSMTMNVNLMGAVNLFEAVKKAAPPCRILVIGTADQYGVVTADMCPLKESTPVSPKSPYALSKTLQEQAAKYYVKEFGLDIVLVRAFNHIGPGQNTGFVIPDFASRIAGIELGLASTLFVGNLNAARDFSDVRDIVRGYHLLVEKGAAGEVYNIGSGKPVMVKELLNILLSLSKKDIEVREDPDKIRPSDAPVIYADCSKIFESVGYKPEIDIRDTLAEILDYWRLRVKEEI